MSNGNEIFADVFTTDTTWQFQLWSNGQWNWHSQAEYRAEQACREAAEQVYGGGLAYRLIRHDRTIVE
jgi:hypothetical protein